MSANDGGPVYPVTGFMADASGALCGQTVTSTGLSILDHFAGLAMQGDQVVVSLIDGTFVSFELIR